MSQSALEPFPQQFLKSMNEGANHLGLGLDDDRIDTSKEFFPAGQGVGAIDELVPAGELVRRIVDEAEHALARAASTVVR